MATRAQPRNVKDSDLSRTARQIWADFCDHRNDNNEAYPRVETQAKRCGISVRTAQRGRSELLKDNRWACILEHGGRGKPAMFHLHPDGNPCDRQQGGVKKGDKMSSFAPQERVTNATERVTESTAKGDKNGRALKEEPPEVNPQVGTTPSTPRAREAITTPQVPGVVVVEGAPFNKNSQGQRLDPRVEYQFTQLEEEFALLAPSDDDRRLQQMTKDKFGYIPLLRHSWRLTPRARMRILRAAERYRFTLTMLRYAFREHRGGLKQVGGLIDFAEKWDEYTMGIEWPNCMECGDSGKVICPGSPYNNRAPCACEAGRNMSNEFPHFEEWKAGDTAFCVWCCNSGPCSKCERGQQAAVREEQRAKSNYESLYQRSREQGLKEQREYEEHLARRQTFEAKLICPDCEGKSLTQNRWCNGCKGTGEYRTQEEWTAIGKCWLCCGTGKTKRDRACHLCNRSGMSRRRANSAQTQTSETLGAAQSA